MPAFHLRATLLPGADTSTDLWIRDGLVSFAPVDGAVELASAPVWVLPGLVDAHAHLALDKSGQNRPPSDALIEENLRAHLRAGTLLVRDPGSPRGESIAWQEQRAGLPRVQSASRFLAPEGRYMPIGDWAAPEQLGEAAARHARSGARWVKIVGDWPRFDKTLMRPVPIPNYDADALRAAVEAAHANGARVAIHATGPEAIRAAVEAGVDSIEHGDALDEGLLAMMAVKGLAWTPTLAMSELLADAQRYTGDAHARFVRERYDRAAQLLPVAHRLGVRILAGTDLLAHGQLYREIDALSRHGLGPIAALEAASTGALYYLGEAGLADGAPANFVAYGQDPRSDPEVLRQPAMVMLGGEVVRL